MAAKKASKKTAKETLKKDKSTGETTSASKSAKTYDPRDSYQKGEVVFHPRWQDEGPVVDTGETAEGLATVSIDFAEVGLKKLVMNYELEI